MLALVVLAAMKARAAKGGVSVKGSWPLYVKKPLSIPEQVLYHRLIKALPEHIVLAQVQVSRVLGVKKGANFGEWNNRINRLSYDFVVCAKDSTALAAIELDDSSHDKQARRQTDIKKDKATSDAGLKLVRWNVRDMPDEEAIRREFAPRALAVKPL
ncbi:MAG: DUF2726 domain-containing protein [Burkholderiaceae bacterium]